MSILVVMRFVFRVRVEVRAAATFLGMEGKLYRFKVEAFDAGGLIGEGEHTRAIVTTERLVNGAFARNQARPPGGAPPR